MSEYKTFIDGWEQAQELLCALPQLNSALEQNWGSAEKTFIWNDAMLEQCRGECKVTDVNYT